MFFQALLDVAQGGDGVDGLLQIQAAGVVGVELRQGVPVLVALFEVLVVVQAMEHILYFQPIFNHIITGFIVVLYLVQHCCVRQIVKISVIYIVFH